MMQPTILVTGGGGYIGSHTAYFFMQKGYKVILLDRLGHGQSFDYEWATLIRADFSDRVVLDSIFTNHTIEAVIHCAALIEVRQSIQDPLSFYENNVVKTVRLLEAMIAHNVRKIIFSSSCAVYGIPHYLPLIEEHPKNPISPYGASKLMVEMILADFSRAYDLQYVALRYFNAAGGMPEYGLAERHDPETHLIPILLRAAMEQKPFALFGNDHATSDGSCVRDYVHVWDIAYGHWRAFRFLQEQQQSAVFNLGTGQGVSVKQLIQTVQELLNVEIEVQEETARAGDPAVLVADPSRAMTDLGWRAKYSPIRQIVQDAHRCTLLPLCTNQAQAKIIYST